MEVKEAIRRESSGDMMLEEAPAYDSRSNGEIERAIQTVQGQVRTIKDAVEARCGEKLRPDDHIVPWMVQHAGALISRYHRGADGLTAYRRVRGKDFKTDICEFGEGVWYMKPGSVGKNKFDSRWEAGIYLGMVDSSGEKIIGTSEGCMKVRNSQKKIGAG